MQVVYERCAGIDVAKKEIAVCVRTPGEHPGERLSMAMRKSPCAAGSESPLVAG